MNNQQKTTACIVGAGPAGVMLSYLLARKDIEVILLEAQKDFDREFRGDSIHPNIMENLEELGLAEKILKLPHSKLRNIKLHTPDRIIEVGDFSHLKTKYPYITMMPQDRFLKFVTDEAKQFKNFTLIMEAKMKELIKEGEKITGIIYHTPEGEQKIRADLIVACDGRFSTVRKQAGMEISSSAPPIDVLWFKLPKKPSDQQLEGGIRGNVGPGQIAPQIDRGDYWQIGYVIPKGYYKKLQDQGIEAFHQAFGKLVPDFSERIKEIENWDDIGFLPVEAGQLKTWYQDGLLLIGDAAHVMSPVGGVGINYAIQDAIVTANILTKPLQEGKLSTVHLAQVQKKRHWPTSIILWFQAFAHKRFLKEIVIEKTLPTPPFPFRFQWVRNLFIRFLAMGIWQVHVDQS